jgi:hypothetical protein
MMMDSISILSLTGGCITVAFRVATTIELLAKADRAVTSLAVKLRLIAKYLEMLEQWLAEREAVVSNDLRSAISLSIADCETILADLEAHVIGYSPVGSV